MKNEATRSHYAHLRPMLPSSGHRVIKTLSQACSLKCIFFPKTPEQNYVNVNFERWRRISPNRSGNRRHSRTNERRDDKLFCCSTMIIIIKKKKKKPHKGSFWALESYRKQHVYKSLKGNNEKYSCLTDWIKQAQVVRAEPLEESAAIKATQQAAVRAVSQLHYRSEDSLLKQLLVKTKINALTINRKLTSSFKIWTNTKLF